MIRAALKSLLGRKVRLLMSTFAIVLGVAFVAGSLVFSDTLSRSFTALFASTVGDVVVRPEGGTTADGAPSTRDGARRAWSSSCATSPVRPASTATSTRSASTSSTRTTRSSAASARRRSAATGPTPRPGTARGPRDHRRAEPAGRRRGGARREHGRAGRATPSATRSTSSPRPRRAAATGAARRPGSADPGRASPASRAAARSTAPRSPPSTPRPPRTSSSTARTPTPTSGSPPRTASPRSELRDAVERGAPRRHRGGHRRRRRRRVGLRPARGDLVPHHLPADLRRHLPGGRRVPDRQHVLDPGRPAQPGAGAAARPRRLQAAGDLVGAARGVRARRARLDDRPRTRRAAGDGHPGALRERSGSTCPASR